MRAGWSIGLGLLGIGLAGIAAAAGPEKVLDIDPGPGNPRNSEGAFAALGDGRLLFAYTHFTGSADDAGTAHIAGRYSSDEGKTWSGESHVVLPNEGQQNTMSVSLLRLSSGPLAFFYLRKNSDYDCRLYLRTSRDDAATWSEPVLCTAPMGYFVVNNDRVVQLASGRLVVPAARHAMPGEAFVPRAQALCYLSDDDGQTWRASETVLDAPAESKTGLQEPGVVELADGRLLMLCRTDLDCQLRSYSSDGGATWSPAESTDLKSPVSPASIKRIPGAPDLLLVWNDHRDVPKRLLRKRTPLSVAISRDHGAAWQPARTLETDPEGWYCYTAIHFTRDAHVLLAYCAGGRALGGLNRTRILRVPLAWLME